MASSVTISEYPFALNGGTYDGITLRNTVVAGMCFHNGTAQVYTGVLTGAGSMLVATGSGMQVQVSAGYAVIASSVGSTYGGYIFPLTSAATLSIATSDPTNPRIDLVCATVNDTGTSSSTGVVQVITGTAAASPSTPATPATSIPLAAVLVPASSSSVTSGNITDVRPFTVALGGVVPVQAIASAPLGYNGCYAHDRSTNRLWQLTGSGPAQVQTLPWAPVMAATTTPVGSGTTQVLVLSASFTANGTTDVKISFKCSGIVAHGGAGDPFFATWRLDIDGAQIDAAYSWNPSDDGNVRNPVEITHYTNAVLGDTPTAGTHTAQIYLSPTYALGGTFNVFANAASFAPITLRVEPVAL